MDKGIYADGKSVSETELEQTKCSYWMSYAKGLTGPLWFYFPSHWKNVEFWPRGRTKNCGSHFTISMANLMCYWHFPRFSQYFLIVLNWRRVDLQWLMCTAKWFSYKNIYIHTLYTYIYTCVFFFRFFSITDYYNILNVIPSAVSRPCCTPILYTVVYIC